jgi:hypothetical protein
MVDEYGMDTRPLSQPVIDLMEHIWKEATGEIEHVISSPLQSIKLEQVRKRPHIKKNMAAPMSTSMDFKE